MEQRQQSYRYAEGALLEFPRTTPEADDGLASRPEQAGRSFDVLASVRMFRDDLASFGAILPETYDRVCDEEISYLAEGIDRSARTTFGMQRDRAGNLVYFDRGQWRPYVGMLLTGISVAQQEAANDPRRQFLADRAADDLLHAYAMQALQPDEQYIWHSPFPYQQAEQFGDAFMQECGFLPGRQMGFLYRAACTPQGEIILESQTIDRSDDAAFSAALAVPEYDAQADMDTLVRTYDGILAQKYGGHFFAGRRGAEIGENAWDTLLAQRDLIDYFLQGLERIAYSELDGESLERVVKRHVYGVWAAFKNRIDGVTTGTADGCMDDLTINQEVLSSFQRFAREGRVLAGCGGSVTIGGSEAELFDASVEKIFAALFGSDGGSESYTFDKKMYCVVCQAPPQKEAKRKWCGPCGICRGCDKQLKRSNEG